MQRFKTRGKEDGFSGYLWPKIKVFSAHEVSTRECEEAVLEDDNVSEVERHQDNARLLQPQLVHLLRA